MNRIVLPIVISRTFSRTVCQNLSVKDRFLTKFLKKKKKRSWHDVPTLSTDNVTFSKAKPNPGSARRVQQLSFILHRYITDMIYGGEIDEELLNTGVQISRVRLLSDLTGINITWTASGTETDDRTQEILERNAAKIRSTLSQMYIMGRVPQITFVKDKHTARLAEVERLLKIADMGPNPTEEETELLGTDSETELSDSESTLHRDLSMDCTPKTNVLGLDHAALMKSVIISKNKSKDRSFNLEQQGTGPFNLEGVAQYLSEKNIQEQLPPQKVSKFLKRVDNKSRYEEDLSIYDDKYKDTFDDVDIHYQDDNNRL
uniref:Ribosomal binding factor A n=1 Tax=Cerebratulus lacteus TaxID=6221 RepID=X5FKX9_CERLA|nr:ribosomal binding factor A [Cerebratulus lacteus]